MELCSTFSLLVVVAALFAYLNPRCLRLLVTIGLMMLSLLDLVGLGVPAVLRVVGVVRTIDFHTVLMQYRSGLTHSAMQVIK